MAAAPIAPIAAVAVGVKRRKILSAFRVAKATSEAAAKPVEQLGLSRGLMFGRLIRAGVIKETPQGVWLDEAMEASHRKARQRIALTVVLVGAVALVVIALVV